MIKEYKQMLAYGAVALAYTALSIQGVRSGIEAKLHQQQIESAPITTSLNQKEYDLRMQEVKEYSHKANMNFLGMGAGIIVGAFAFSVTIDRYFRGREVSRRNQPPNHIRADEL